MREICLTIKKYWLTIVVMVGLIGIICYQNYSNESPAGGKQINMVFACPDGQGGKCWHREGEIKDDEIVGFYTEAGKLVPLSCMHLTNSQAGEASTEYQCEDESGNQWMVYRGMSFKSFLK